MCLGSSRKLKRAKQKVKLSSEQTENYVKINAAALACPLTEEVTSSDHIADSEENIRSQKTDEYHT